MKVASMYLPCGSTAEFDYGSGCSHRCTRCNATVGSVSTPKECKAAMDKYETLRALGGNVQWDYITGKEIVVLEFGE